jgi:hypothetical protein
LNANIVYEIGCQLANNLVIVENAGIAAENARQVLSTKMRLLIKSRFPFDIQKPFTNEKAVLNLPSYGFG